MVMKSTTISAAGGKNVTKADYQGGIIPKRGRNQGNPKRIWTRDDDYLDNRYKEFGATIGFVTE